jgi:hypothetical protein
MVGHSHQVVLVPNCAIGAMLRVYYNALHMRFARPLLHDCAGEHADPVHDGATAKLVVQPF